MHFSGKPGWHDPNTHRPPRRCSADVSATSLFRCDAFGSYPRAFYRVLLLAPATPSVQRLKEANAKAAPRCALKPRLDAHYISKFFHLRRSHSASEFGTGCGHSLRHESPSKANCEAQLAHGPCTAPVQPKYEAMPQPHLGE